MTINFYKTKDPYGEFSNFSRHAIFLDGKIWPTTEHYFQAMKSTDEARQEEIRKAAAPAVAARMGRDRSYSIREDWDSVHRDHFMSKALFAKFTQYPQLKKLLIGTGDETLVEHTKNDSYWGDGGDGSGQNKLGKMLMELREQLKGKRSAT